MFNLFCTFKPSSIHMVSRVRLAIFSLLTSCLAIATLGCGYSANNASAGPLQVSPSVVDFGSVSVGQVALSSVALVNKSSAPIDISQLNIAGQKFFANSKTDVPVTISAGGTYTFIIGFSPDSVSTYSGEFVAMGKSNQPLVKVPINGLGIGGNSSKSALAVSTHSASFGSVPVGSTVTQLVTLASAGTAPVTINKISTPSDPAFSVSAGTIPATLNPGQTMTLKLRYDPSAVGNDLAQVAIESDASNGNIQNIQLSGTGTTTLNAQLAISTTSLAFGNVTVGSASTQPVTMTSTGTSPVTIRAAVVTGSGFTIPGSTFPLYLNPGQSTTMNVKFDPAATGVAAGQLTLQSDSSANSTAVVSLSGAGTSAPNPQLTASTAALTFDKVTVGSASTQPVTLTSTGTAPVTIRGAGVSGRGFAVSGVTLPVTLNPGQSVTAHVKFAPDSAGVEDGALTIQSNSSANGTATVNLSGTGTSAAMPQLSISTGAITFGNVTVGSTSTQPVTLTSTGTAPVTISAAKVTGKNFAVSGSSFPVTLSPNQSVTLELKFEPSSTGAEHGQLRIQSDSSTNSTAVVSLSGTGTAATTPQLSISTAALTFGSVTVDSSSSQSVTLTSTGTAPVTVNGATVTGSGFAVSGATFPVTLNPSQSVSLKVQFSPSSASAASGRLTVQSDSSTNSTAVVNLSGTGTAATTPQLSISTAALTFGSVTVGSSSSQPVTLTSTGTAPVTINGATVTGSNFSVAGVTFPVTVNSGQSVSLKVQFSPSSASAASGQLTIQSNSSTNGTAVVNLSGTGTSGLIPLSALSCGKTSLTGAGTDTCTVTLAAAAGASGQQVTVASSSNVVAVPTAVTVAANTTSASFNASVSSFTSSQAVTLTATSAGASKKVALQLTAPVPTLTASEVSVAFGNVTVKAPSTQPVTLSSTGTAPVTINSVSLSGTGYSISGATFPVTLAPGIAVTLDVTLNPATTGAATGTLTINSNSSTNATYVIALSGTGVSAPHTVGLSWVAPSSSPDAVAGYHVYRSSSSSSSFVLLNSSLITNATYVDSSVQSGQTYNYEVKSVDSSGAESVSSNEATATIP